MKKLLLALLVVLPMGCSLRTSPPTADMYFSWGLKHKNRGDLAGASTLFTKAIELRKDYMLAYYNRGEAKQDLHDFVGAAADYDTVIQLAPSFWSPISVGVKLSKRSLISTERCRTEKTVGRKTRWAHR